MAWIVENRRTATVERRELPYLTEEMKKHLTDTYFPRYPTKRAVTLPALHYVQHTYNWIPTQAMEEIAEFLGLQPSEVLDTATFYEEYWLKPKGKYLIAVCRSLACELCGAKELMKQVQAKLKVENMETTPDGRYTFMEIECLGSCGTAPVALVNEVLLENVMPEQLVGLIDKLPAEPHDYKDPVITWETGNGHAHAADGHHSDNGSRDPHKTTQT